MNRGIDIGITMGQSFSDVASVISQQVRDRGDELNEDSPLVAEAASYHERHGARLEEAGARNPLELIAMLLLTRLFAAADFLRGVGVIAVHGSHRERQTAFSTAPVARALLETLAQIHWLAEPDVGDEERVRRLVDDTIRDHAARHRIVSAARADGIDIVIETEGLGEMCDLYGVKWRWGRTNPETGIRLPILTAGNARPSAFETLSTLMPSEEYKTLGAILYNLMSDVAHASTQGLLGRASVRGDGTGLDLGFSRLEILKSVAPVLWAVHVPIHTAYAFLGWDEASFRDTFAAAANRLSDAAPDESRDGTDRR